jgi:hypothetical protein
MSPSIRIHHLLLGVFCGCIFIIIGCARLGEAAVTFSEQNQVPAQPIVTGVTKPGMGSAGGPLTWAFWAKNRQATSDALLGSFTPFYKINAVRLAVSNHFVLYRDVLGPFAMDSTAAATVLATMESAYSNLKTVYGGGDHPYANDGARVVILAYDILDDYSTTGNYVGGYFSPRDLYSNTFTTALFTDPVAIQQYSSQIGALGGYSNEMSIINYDLAPGYSTNSAQVNDIVIHELSHLFTYSKRVVKQRLTNHDLWIAEGIAENAPHQTIQTANVQQLRLTQLASPSVIDYYQDAPQLTDFLTWASKIVGYLQSNLFFNYLRHRAETNSAGSAATMLAALMSQSDGTVDGVDSLIQSYVPGSTFNSLYGDFVLTHYLMLLGYPIDATTGLNGAAANQTVYSFSNVQIGNSASTVNGLTIKSKYSATIPFNFEGPKCADGSVGLRPNSYIIFRHKYDGGDKTTTDAAGTGAVAGELPLKYIINTTTENVLIGGSPPATMKFVTYNQGTTLPLGSVIGGANGWNANDTIHMILYNPNKTGSCRPFDGTLILKRNHSKWIGSNSYGTQPSPDFEWQTDTGAVWKTSENGSYYRPGGIAAYTGTYPNNFLFVVDYNNMSLQKVNLDAGTAVGRLGSTVTACPSTGSGWDNSTNRYVNGYCVHQFDSPQGVYVDSTQTIFVADSNNRRLVKYNSAGVFQGWLGLNGVGNDIWKAAGTETDPTTLYNNGSVDDPRMFLIPWALTSDSNYLYVADYGTSRIIRRRNTPGVPATDGQFHSYIGNGNNAWNTSTATQAGSTGTAAGYFHFPRGIVLSGGNLYIVDEINHRIVRVDVTTGNSTGWLGDGGAGWQSMATTPSGTGSGNNRYFKNPSAIATDGTSLYIADRLNNRIVKWDIAGTYRGWLGHGKVTWELTQAAPATDPYAGVSYYPPDYYSEPHGLAIATAAAKGTHNTYLFVTSVYNGRVTRINLSCVDAPATSACDPLYSPFVP